MKITLDRRACICWNPACETHFGWHLLRDEITPIDCVVEMADDGSPDLTFFVKDRDGTDKVLVVNETNRGVAYDSWLQAWEQKQSRTAS